jgi:hypothetical protein
MQNVLSTTNGLTQYESSEIDIIPHHRHVEDRLRSYMGIFEIKNALKAFQEYMMLKCSYLMVQS